LKFIASYWTIFTILLSYNYSLIGHGGIVFLLYFIITLNLIKRHRRHQFELSIKSLQLNSIASVFFIKYFVIFFILNWIIFTFSNALFFFLSSFLLASLYLPHLAQKIKEFNPKAFNNIQIYVDVLFEEENYTIDNLDMSMVKKRYRELVKIHHPDKGGHRDRFEKIQEAYENLKEKLDK
jgi:hypothetical protein